MLNYLFFNKYIVNDNLTTQQLIIEYNNNEFIFLVNGDSDYILKQTNNYIYLCIVDKLNEFDNLFKKIDKQIKSNKISIDNYTVFFIYMISNNMYDAKYLKYIKNKESDVFFDVVMSDGTIELNIFNYKYFNLLYSIIKNIDFNQKQIDGIVKYLDDCYYVSSNDLIENFYNKISPAVFVDILHDNAHGYDIIDKFIQTLKNKKPYTYFSIIDFNCILVKDEQVLYFYEKLFNYNLIKDINNTFKEFILETSIDSKVIFNKIVKMFVENSLEIEWLKTITNRYSDDSLDLKNLYEEIKLMQREIKINRVLVG